MIRPDQKRISRIVDDHGRIVSETNARGQTTTYVYDVAGRVTKISPPGAFADTSIVYWSTGNGLKQTITRGNSRTVTTYDGFIRPILVQAMDLTGHSPARYTKTRYDALGRTVFASFPSHSPNPTTGVDTSYDALGRVTQVRETVAPYATTRTAYLSGNKVQVTDPIGARTTTTYQAWGAPSTVQASLIQQTLGMTTSMTYDAWGNLTSASQGGVTQTWTYDSRFRLCNHFTPEQNGTVYAYDNANQVTYMARGQGTGCSSNAADRIHYTYDAMGRQTLINFPAGTTDISKTYDANGNLLTSKRGGVNWTYAYNELDLLTQETLRIDGRTYETSHGYNTTGHLSSMNTPSGTG
ncbi:MAG: hypothetical protein AAF725_14410, partial [Acidobacteriota bacterium]